MAAEGKDMDGMDIDLDELRANLSKYKGTVYILGLVSSYTLLGSGYEWPKDQA